MGERVLVSGIQRLAAILKQIDFGVHREHTKLLSKIIFYLLQDGCTQAVAAGQHQSPSDKCAPGLVVYDTSASYSAHHSPSS